MKKIPTLFVRNPEDRAHVLDAVNPGCEWVIEGFGKATAKWDGTCVKLADDGQWWARREVKSGKQPPANFVLADLDEVTGKRQGWEPIEQSAFAKFHAEALETITGLLPGTYELVGTKINGNPHHLTGHYLPEHGMLRLDPPLTFDNLAVYLRELQADKTYEGIVWWHPDGRKAKLKARDFA